MENKYFVSFFLVFGILIIIVSLFFARTFTGNIIAEYDDFEIGDEITGRLIIDVSGKQLPLGSVVTVRFKDQTQTLPLVSLLDVDERNRASTIEFYPDLVVFLDFTISGDIEHDQSIREFITGYVGKEESVEQGVQVDPINTFTYESYLPFIASVDGKVLQFDDDVNLLDADVTSASLADGTRLDTRMVNVLIDGNMVTLVSTYSEELIGYPAGSTVDIPLEPFELRADIGELVADINGPYNTLLSRGKNYLIPGVGVVSGDDGVRDRDLSFKVNPMDVISARKRVGGNVDCGPVRCALDECVQPDSSSAGILGEDVKIGLVTKITCYDPIKEIPKLKKERLELKQVYSQTL